MKFQEKLFVLHLCATTILFAILLSFLQGVQSQGAPAGPDPPPAPDTTTTTTLRPDEEKTYGGVQYPGIAFICVKCTEGKDCGGKKWINNMRKWKPKNYTSLPKEHQEQCDGEGGIRACQVIFNTKAKVKSRGCMSPALLPFFEGDRDCIEKVVVAGVLGKGETACGCKSGDFCNDGSEYLSASGLQVNVTLILFLLLASWLFGSLY